MHILLTKAYAINVILYVLAPVGLIARAHTNKIVYTVLYEMLNKSMLKFLMNTLMQNISIDVHMQNV